MLIDGAFKEKWDGRQTDQQTDQQMDRQTVRKAG